MKAFQETTKDWVGNVSNHIYYLSDDKRKLYAFYNVSTKKVTKLKKPIGFDPRYRTFKELK
jgi:formaldehyde-activating enzyme involved in methanogenesis